VYSEAALDDLSPRQREILDFILAFMDQRGVAPTFRDIGLALGIKSTNGVSDHLKALEKKGYLERAAGPGAPRSIIPSIRATGRSDDLVATVPVVGRIAAGQPLLATESFDGSVRIDRDLLPASGELFALVVKGDSMIEDGIHDGDTLFVRKQPTARDGEIAAVLVEDEATVKRVFREGALLRLQPANASMDPIVVDPRRSDVSILGVAVGLFRRM
jgi:repressor LexA